MKQWNSLLTSVMAFFLLSCTPMLAVDDEMEVISADQFNAGDTVIINTEIIDQEGIPIPHAVAEFTIEDYLGNIVAVILSDPSTTEGIATGYWSTEASNKIGQGGTDPGVYTITVTKIDSEYNESQSKTRITVQ